MVKCKYDACVFMQENRYYFTTEDPSGHTETIHPVHGPAGTEA